ncbi:hypothetical protein [Streptomyces roseolus]|uniref:hypothetical protein n=1 Tax=Streptomyces roseolus TaxID=67358 RepID=UPI0036E0501A
MIHESGTKSRWGTIGAFTAGALLVAGAMTVGAALSGEDRPEAAPSEGAGTAQGRSARGVSGSSSDASERWVEPERWAVLPRGERLDGYGSSVGFPHTREGAVAMLAAFSTMSAQGERSTGDERRRVTGSYLSREDRSSDTSRRLTENARQADESSARQMGVEEGQPYPPGAYFRSTAIGYKIIYSTDDEVGVWILAQTTMKTGKTAREQAVQTRVPFAARWEDGDWKLSGEAGGPLLKDAVDQLALRPEYAAVGDAEFNIAGWTAIRTAS